jgi:hypothetical protein
MSAPVRTGAPVLGAVGHAVLHPTDDRACIIH